MQFRIWLAVKIVLAVFIMTHFVSCINYEENLYDLNSPVDFNQFHINSFCIYYQFYESEGEKNYFEYKSHIGYPGNPCVLSFSDEKYFVFEYYWDPASIDPVLISNNLENIGMISYRVSPHRGQLQIKDLDGYTVVLDILKDDLDSPDFESYKKIISFLKSKNISVSEAKNVYELKMTDTKPTKIPVLGYCFIESSKY